MGASSTHDLARSITLAGFEDLDDDTWLSAIVEGIKGFGIFVRAVPPDGVGSAVGLVPKTMIKEGFVDDPAEEVVEGQEVKVRVVQVDRSSGRLTFSMVGRPQGNVAETTVKHPEIDASKVNANSRRSALLELKRVSPTLWLPGVVTEVLDFGAIVVVETPKERSALGLLHMSHAKDGDIDALDVGEAVRVQVLKVDLQSGRLSFSTRGGSPVLNYMRRLRSTEWMTGVVRRIEFYGAWVAVKTPRGKTVVGLVPTGSLAGDFVKSSWDVVELDQEVQVRKVRIDEEDLVELSMIDDDAALRPFRGADPQEWTSGVVQHVDDRYGALLSVESPEGSRCQGFLHVLHTYSQSIEGLVVGKELPVRVLGVQDDQRRLRLATKEPDDLESFAQLPSTEWLTGVVKCFVTNGFLVRAQHPDGGKATGYVHRSEIRYGFVKDAASEVSVGQEVRVRSIRLDRARFQLFFSMKRPTPNWVDYDELE